MQSRLDVLLTRLVRHHDQGDVPVFPAALLDDRLNADIVAAQDAGDGGQHPGTVFHHKSQVVGRYDFGERPDGNLLPVFRRIGKKGHPRSAPSRGCQSLVAGDLDDVRRDGRAGRQRSRPAPDQNVGIRLIAFDVDGVEGAAHLGNDVTLRKHGWTNPDVQAPVHPLGLNQKLDAVSQLPCEFQVHRLDAANPLDEDLFHFDGRAEAQVGQDRDLVGRVDPVHVEGGVGLGQTLGLGLFENGFKILTLLGHLRQDVVRRAIDNPEDRLDDVGRESLFDGPDDGNRSPHGPFKSQVQTHFRGCGEDLFSMLGQKGLVGRDDVLSGLQGTEDQGLGRFVSADKLHHDVNLRVAQEAVHVLRQDPVGDLHAPVRGHVQVGNALNADGKADAALDLPRVVLQRTDQAGTNRPKTDDSDVEVG